jgi:hypothetical protein
MSAKPSAPKVTTIQLRPETRDRLYRLKFRKTYDAFLSELCDLYERTRADDSRKEDE